MRARPPIATIQLGRIGELLALALLLGVVQPEAVLDWLLGPGAPFPTTYQLISIVWIVANDPQMTGPISVPSAVYQMPPLAVASAGAATILVK